MWARDMTSDRTQEAAFLRQQCGFVARIRSNSPPPGDPAGQHFDRTPGHTHADTPNLTLAPSDHFSLGPSSVPILVYTESMELCRQGSFRLSDSRAPVTVTTWGLFPAILMAHPEGTIVTVPRDNYMRLEWADNMIECSHGEVLEYDTDRDVRVVSIEGFGCL